MFKTFKTLQHTLNICNTSALSKCKKVIPKGQVFILSPQESRGLIWEMSHRPNPHDLWKLWWIISWLHLNMLHRRCDVTISLMHVPIISQLELAERTPPWRFTSRQVWDNVPNRPHPECYKFFQESKLWDNVPTSNSPRMMQILSGH